jgi:GAF domain-containing protein
MSADAANAVSKLSRRLASLEDQCTGLANFYVAVQRLYTSTGRDDVLSAIVEIVANLVGSEEIAVFEKGDDGLTLTLANGVAAEPLRKIPSGTGLIGWVAQAGEMLLPEARSLPSLPSLEPYEESLTACIPLLLRGRVTGAVAIFKLLPQKSHLSELDHGLFEVLQSHAGLALYVATALGPGPTGARP